MKLKKNKKMKVARLTKTEFELDNGIELLNKNSQKIKNNYKIKRIIGVSS